MAASCSRDLGPSFYVQRFSGSNVQIMQSGDFLRLSILTAMQQRDQSKIYGGAAHAPKIK
jgi:hypothetical protein